MFRQKLEVYSWTIGVGALTETWATHRKAGDLSRIARIGDAEIVNAHEEFTCRGCGLRYTLDYMLGWLHFCIGSRAVCISLVDPVLVLWMPGDALTMLFE
jgi:hypothetical protein